MLRNQVEVFNHFREDGQLVGIPRVEHLVEDDKRVICFIARRLLARCQNMSGAHGLLVRSIVLSCEPGAAVVTSGRSRARQIGEQAERR